MSEKSENSGLENVKMKKNIFQTPEGYFEKLHKDILNNLELDSNFSHLDAENLKKNIFKVPKNYFELSEKRIAERIETEYGTRIVPLYKRNWFQSVAAAVALIAVFVFGIKSDDAISNYEYAELSDEVIIEYLLDEEMSYLDILASIDDGVNILDELFEDEMSSVDFSDYDNPEMEYDFEYIEY